MKNLLNVSSAMLVENGLNIVLRFFVGLKTFFDSESGGTTSFVNFVIPIIFFHCWLYVRYEASIKNGHYGAPISLLKKFDE